PDGERNPASKRLPYREVERADALRRSRSRSSSAQEADAKTGGVEWGQDHWDGLVDNRQGRPNRQPPSNVEPNRSHDGSVAQPNPDGVLHVPEEVVRLVPPSVHQVVGGNESDVQKCRDHEVASDVVTNFKRTLGQPLSADGNGISIWCSQVGDDAVVRRLVVDGRRKQGRKAPVVESPHRCRTASVKPGDYGASIVAVSGKEASKVQAR